MLPGQASVARNRNEHPFTPEASILQLWLIPIHLQAFAPSILALTFQRSTLPKVGQLFVSVLRACHWEFEFELQRRLWTQSIPTGLGRLCWRLAGSGPSRGFWALGEQLKVWIEVARVQGPESSWFRQFASYRFRWVIRLFLSLPTRSDPWAPGPSHHGHFSYPPCSPCTNRPMFQGSLSSTSFWTLQLPKTLHPSWREH